MARIQLRSWFLLSCIVVMSSGLLRSQEFRAGLVGVITDSSAAAIVGAQVSAVNMETGVSTRTVSGAGGNYSISFLPPATYRLEVQHPGFKSYVQSGIVLQIQERPTIDVKLETGEVNTSVTVDASVMQLETASASRGDVISERVVVDMPLNGRNVFMLGLLTPGVTFTARGQTNSFIRTTSTGGMTSISLSGGTANFNEALLDGVPNTGSDGTIQYVPSVEATQEFKVQTNIFDAEFGRFTGGVINATTKSGTNQVHGVLYEFFRNSVLNGRDPFAVDRPQFGYNLFGGSVGGPVRIPKVYNGTNKTFFFVNYEGSREGVPRATVATVPTELQRAGDFSGTFVRQGNTPVQVLNYDPATTRASGSAFIRDPFPGNKIPINRMDPVAVKIMQYFPHANSLGDPVTGANNFLLSYKDPVLDNGVLVRLDHRFSDRHQVFARYSSRHSLVGSSLRNPLNAINGTDNNRYSTGLALDDTFMISPTTILNIRYGFTRLYANTPSATNGFDATQLGLPASFLRQLDVEAFPVISVGGYQSLSRAAKTNNAEDSHTLRGAITRVSGRHAMRIGGEVRVLRSNLASPASDGAGSFTFSNTFTRGPNPQAASTTAGSALAAFLLGLPASGSASKTAFTAEQVPYYGAYFQDDVRLTSKITMNLGLRYEWEGENTERYNRFNRGFDMSADSPIAAQARANYALNPIPEVPVSQFQVKGGLLFAGVNGQPRGITNQDRNNFSPRIGIAYHLANRTVIRAGYGIFYGATSLLTETRQGFSQSTPFLSSIDGGLTPVNTLSNPFPDGVLNASGSALGLMTLVGQNVTFVDLNRQNPMAQQYQFGVQHQLTQSLVLEASYAGSLNQDLAVSKALNSVPLGLLNQAQKTFQQTGRNVLNDSVPNPFYGLITSGNLSGKTTTRGQLVTAYPQFTGVTEANLSNGSSRYDSLQLKGVKRLSKGISFMAAYTISKQLEQTRYLNSQDTELTKEIVDFNVPQRLVVSGSWEIPFGPGRTFASNVTGIRRKLIEGWQTNVIYTAQGGVPLEISGGESVGRSAKLDQPQVTRWFDTTAFRQRVTLENVGTARLPDVRSDGRNNIDLSLFKTTTIAETVRLQFRAESFNAFNHPEWAVPNTTFGSANFGIVTATNVFARQYQFGLRLLW